MTKRGFIKNISFQSLDICILDDILGIKGFYEVLSFWQLGDKTIIADIELNIDRIKSANYWKCVYDIERQIRFKHKIS
jgi:hypothetical protein